MQIPMTHGTSSPSDQRNIKNETLKINKKTITGKRRLQI